MPFNVLLLPLLGGYILISVFHLTRYRMRRQSGRKVIFESAIAGTVLLGISVLIVQGISESIPSARRAWKAFAPFAYSGARSLSLLLGCVLPLIGNLIWTREDAIRQGVIRENDHFEALIVRAIDNSEYVLLTTESRKVYVGFIICGSQFAHEREYVRIWPILSGYRSSESHEVHYTTFYAPIYERLYLRPNAASVDPRDFEIVLPASTVTTMSIFDEEVHAMFDTESK